MEEGSNQVRRPPTANELKQLKIVQAHKSFRILVISATVFGCVWKIVDGLVKLLDKPPWVTALTAFLAVLGATVVQTPLLYRVTVYVRRFTRRAVSWNSKLEELIDKTRTSSGLTDEGEDAEARKQ